MVIDPDQLLRRRRGRLEHPQPIERRAVAGHHHCRRSWEPVGRHQQFEPGKHVGPAREVRGVVGERTDDLGSSRHEMVREPEHRSEGVGVGVHVACHRDAVGIAQDVGGPGKVFRRHAKPLPRDAADCGLYPRGRHPSHNGRRVADAVAPDRGAGRLAARLLARDPRPGAAA